MQYFYALNHMQSNPKSFTIIHILGETHSPYWCPGYSQKVYGDPGLHYIEGKEKENVEKQLRKAMLYADEQIKYYDSYIDESRYRIIMSDHGHIRWENKFTVEGRHHVLFSILGKNVLPKIIERVNSILSFSDIIELLMKGKVIEIAEDYGNGVALIENDDPYSKRSLEKLPISEKSGEDDVLRQWIQYRGIVTDAGVYVLWVDGKERFLVSTEETNHISDLDYSAEINNSQKLCGKFFIDIYKEEKYKNSRIIYEDYKIKRKDDNLYV